MKEAARAGESPGTPSGRARFDLAAWVRSSPWLMIAVLLHVLLVTILSVVYLVSERSVPPELVTAVRVAPPALELPPAVDEPPKLIVRDELPPVRSELAGPVNP